MKVKSCPVYVKAAGDGAATGEFEAVVSVFNNFDSWGDVVLPGAFADTLAQWKAGPDALPVLWSHRMDDPTYNIGVVLDAEELAPGDARLDVPGASDHLKANGGLWVRGQIDTGPDASPIAVHALRLLKARRVTQFSFAYDEVDAGPVTIDGTDGWGLKKLKVYEVSPTQVGMNELTELLAAKGFKVGRTLSAANESNIRQAVDLLTSTLSSLDGDAAKRGGPAKVEEPTRAKTEEPVRHGVSTVRLLHDLLALEAAVTD